MLAGHWSKLRSHIPPRVGAVLAYLLALIGAPLLVAVLGFWVLWIPVFAVYFGIIPYLLLAGPGFALTLRYLPPNALIFAGVGLGLNMLTPLVYLGGIRFSDYAPDWAMLRVLWIYGAGFSMLWGACFAPLYRMFLRLLVQNPARQQPP